jgi:hypothetical protein
MPHVAPRPPTGRSVSADDFPSNVAQRLLERDVDRAVVETAPVAVTVAVGTVPAQVVLVADLVMLDAGFEALELGVSGDREGWVDSLVESVLLGVFFFSRSVNTQLCGRGNFHSSHLEKRGGDWVKKILGEMDGSDTHDRNFVFGDGWFEIRCEAWNLLIF